MVERGQLGAVEADAARGRRVHHRDGPAGRRLAASGLADEPEGLASGDVQAHIRHRVDAAPSVAELDHEVLDPEHHVGTAKVSGPAAGHHSPPEVSWSAAAPAARRRRPAGTPLPAAGAETAAWIWAAAAAGRLGPRSSCRSRRPGAEDDSGREPGAEVARVGLFAFWRPDGEPAPEQVAGTGVPQRRLLLLAAGLGVRAARVRTCSPWASAARSGGLPGIAWSLDVARVGEPGDRKQQRLCVRHPGVLEQLARRGLLDDPARVHDDDLVGPVRHDPEVVGDEHHRHRALALLVREQVEDLRLDRHVEPRGGLVREEQLRARRRARSRSSRAGASRPTARAGRRAGAWRVGDADRVEQRDRRVVGRLAVEAEPLAQAFCDLPLDPDDRVESGHRVLEDHRDLRAPDLAQLSGRQVRDLVAGEADGPRVPTRVTRAAAP